MAVDYTLPAIDVRLQAVADLIDTGGNGTLRLKTNSGTVVSTIILARPCGDADGGVLTFLGTLLDPAATTTGEVGQADVLNGSGILVVSGLTVGIPLSGCDIIINNGFNTTEIEAGNTVEVVSAQIEGD